MAHERRFSILDPVADPPCAYLRNKTMFIVGHAGDEAFQDDGTRSGHCWCSLTQHVIGPDDALVGRNICIDGRHCFRAVRE